MFLHRLINETPDGLFTDHINGDKLDNRRSNLRTVTLAENNMNMGKKSSNQSPYVGVSWWKRDRNWKAAVRYGEKNHNLGYYDTPEQAALVYNYYARKYRGEYARLNEILGRALSCGKVVVAAGSDGKGGGEGGGDDAAVCLAR